MTEVLERQPHAILDGDSRRLKAQKIARLVETVRPLRGARLLDIGAGSGYIASNLGELVGDEGEVWAVDVNDQRRTNEGYRFKAVTGTALPFEDDSFDVVLSNHVIEHVGDRSAQLHHLREVGRVLAPGGVCYLAVPNRWGLVEPHFRLPFLSWIPAPLRDPYVRAAQPRARTTTATSRRALRRPGCSRRPASGTKKPRSPRCGSCASSRP